MSFSWEPGDIEKKPNTPSGSITAGVVANISGKLSKKLGLSKIMPCIVAIWRRFVRNTGVLLGAGGSRDKGPVYECDKIRRENMS